MKYKTFSIILLICLILTVFRSLTFINRSYFQIEVEDQQNTNEITNDFPISRKILAVSASSLIDITSNAGLSSIASSGDGSETTPYIIEDHYILANGSSYGIAISNTDKYFTLKDSTVVGASIGFYFYNVTHGTIENCLATNNGQYGFRLHSSSNNTLTSNVATGSSIFAGFIIWTSSYNTLTSNTATNNENGFNIDSSSNNILTSNTATNNVGHGFRISTSSYNTLTSNIATDNSEEGFRFGASSYNTLTNNYATDNSAYGFGLYASSNHNTFTSNTVTYNGNNGFNLKGSSNNTLTSNTVTNNVGHGFYLGESSGHSKLISNTVTKNSMGGFYLASGDHNTLTNNNATDNSWSGFHASSSNNTFTSNTATNNDYGFGLSASSNNTLTSNTATNNDYGFGLSASSTHNTLTNNNATDNSLHGFYLNQASNNTISGNTGSNNDRYGIYLIGPNSDYNEIYLNSFIDNTIGAGQDDSSTSTNVFTNGTHGNYWSDYTGVDFDKNGIGDTPYLIGGGAGTEDLHPLMMTPVISGPSDFGIFYGDTGYSLLWTVTDSYPANLLWTVTDIYPANYIVYRNGTIYDADTWTDSVFIWLIALEEGSHNFTCLVENTFGKMTSDEVWITVLPVTPDLTPPSISSSGNLTFEEGSIGYSITWTGSDDRSPWWASVRRDTTLIYDQPWIGNDIQINLDGLLNGYYIYNCTFFDEAGNSIFDIVTVNVTEPFPDTISPYIISPDPLEFEEKTTGHNLTWICSDDHPYAYTISINDTEIFSPWRGGNITYFVDDLPVGIWEVNLTLYDLSGNSAAGAVIVTVNPEAPDMTVPTVSHPADIIVAENTACTLVWEVDDKYPDRYTIARNGTVIFEHSYWVQGIIQYHLTSIPLGVWEFNLTVWDEAGNSASAIAIVKVLPGSAIDTTSPSISHVPDIAITYGTTNNTFVVYLFDDHPAGYSIAINTEANITEHVWTSPNVKVEFCSDGLAIGSYIVVITAWDTFSNVATRNIKVTVNGDSTPPTISHLFDITAYENMSLQLNWDATDENPSYYELITLPEEVLLQTAPWSGNSIEIILSNLPTGTYQYRLIVYDVSGNCAIDDFTITVIKPRSTPGFELFSIVLCTLLITKLKPYLKCKRRKER